MKDNGDSRRAGAGEQIRSCLSTSPAADRNKEVILEVLKELLPESGEVLEIASGTGQHVVHFAQALPKLCWQPSDPDRALLGAISRRVAIDSRENIKDPVRLDVHDFPWPVETADAMLCANMIHIARWSATEALLQGASSVLRSGSLLILYGPYKRGGVHTAPSNEAFDRSLRERNAQWGVRDLERVSELAAEYGLALDQLVEMPANNCIVAYRRL